jgi:oxygen-independent coproporphyrinogen-3 oxidase
MYEWASQAFEEAGFVQYEISNWAKPGRECRHNLQYWRSLPYLAVGAGAHGYAGGYRYSNVLRIKTYIDRLNTDPRSLATDFPLSPATVNHHRQTKQDDMSEFMITNLRLTNTGAAEADFRSRFGSGLTKVYPKEIEELIGLGLLEWTNESLRLTKRGRLLGNQVFLRFVE